LTEADAGTIERRKLPGGSRAISRITVAVNPPVGAAPALDARTVALLRRARALGVTTFDVASARAPQRAERLLSEAFPEKDPEVSTIVGRSLESLVGEGTSPTETAAGSSLGATLAESLEQSRRRLAPVPIAVVDWDPGPGTASEAPTVLTAEAGSLEGRPAVDWALRIAPGATSLPQAGSATSLFSGPLSLLEPDLIPLFESVPAAPERVLIARDPFSSGRLDGSRFSSGTAFAGPGTPPMDLRQLHAEFDPVLRLGFLTEGHRRTLAQAAIQFVLHWPWVASVVVPLPAPERFDEVFGFRTRPPIAPDEMERLAILK
jgi:aryl-alcohol dehydrogenase-like predicted oxidoreductase